TFAQQVQQSGPAGGDGPGGAGQIAVQLVQEQPGVRLDVEAPDEQPVRAGQEVCSIEPLQEAGRDSGLAGTAQPDQGNHAAEAGAPQVAQGVQLRLATDEVGSARQTMDEAGLRRVREHGRDSLVTKTRTW